MNIPRVLVLVCIAVASAQPRSTPERMRGPRIDAPPAQEPQKWSLSPTPLTSIGGGSSASEMLTRVVTVRRLSDGRILLWEPRPASVRLFNTDGRFSRVFAREGGGPGEVRDAIWIGAVKDTILVFDRTQQRLTRFDSTGRVLSTAPLRIAGGAEAYSVIGRWPGGSFLLRSSDPGYSGRGVSGVRRDSTWVAVADSAGQIVQRLLRVPGAASFTKRLSGGGAYIAQQPFGASGLVAVGGRTVWVGDNATPSIVQYDARGRAIQRVTVPFRSLSVDRNVVEAQRRHELEAARSAAVRALLNEKYAVSAQATPYYSGLAVAPDGDLWVTSTALYDTAAPDVVVLSNEGTLRATLRLPPRFRIVQVDSDAVTGIQRDEDDIEWVRVYRVRREPGRD